MVTPEVREQIAKEIEANPEQRATKLATKYNCSSKTVLRLMIAYWKARATAVQSDVPEVPASTSASAASNN